MTRLVLKLSDDSRATSVERAIMEFHSARPVLIEEVGASALVFGIADLDELTCFYVEPPAAGEAYLALSPACMHHLGIHRDKPACVALSVFSGARVENLTHNFKGNIGAPLISHSLIDLDALELARLSFVLPAAVVIPLHSGINIDASVLRVTGADIRDYDRAEAMEIKIVARAPVPLEAAPESEFVVFRSGEGLRDQVAVIVGNPDLSKPVTVLIHSACLTGDLFGSLGSDCGAPLRRTISSMAQNGGGILLYLDHERRWIGQPDQYYPYAWQAHEYHPHDVDEKLGSVADQRRFDFAARMLRRLGVNAVRAMTDEPAKHAALRRADIGVIFEYGALRCPPSENAEDLISRSSRFEYMSCTT
jgi:GTP cyclohydrolase II